MWNETAGEPDSPESQAEFAPDELRPVVSLFADVVGSTGLGERLSPSEIKTLIGECVSRMCESIEAFGGSVRSYMGDGIAGFFGIDVAREDDCERSARAALEIRRVVAEYSREVKDAWGVADFNVRMGINAGRVAVGRIGAADPQRLALGDSINVAARLQAAAQPGTIVVGRPVAEAIADRFVVHSLGALDIRGRAAPVDAYELEAQGVEVSRPHADAPFVGRGKEVSALSSALSDLADGRGQVVFITGEAGLGKSRLIRETRRRAQADILWLDAYCDSVDERLPYQPVIEALCSWLGVSREGPRIETRIRLVSAARTLFGDEFEDVAPFLARLLGVSLGRTLERRIEGLAPSELEGALARSIGEWLSALARVRPVVLAIDNFCSAAEPTAAAIEQLLPCIEKTPLLVLLAARSETRGAWERLRARALVDYRPRVVDLSLEPLSDDLSRRFVASLAVNHGDLPGPLTDVIVERGDGVPLYIEELFSALSSHGDRDWDAAASLPTAVEGILLARIDQLPPRARRVLQCAAILGRSFTHDVVVGMLEDDEDTEGVVELVRADVIRERGLQPQAYAFRHGLIREAALSTLTVERARLLSRRAAEALKAWSQFDADRDSHALVSYYLDADCEGEVVPYLDGLATQLTRLGRWDEAIALIERCLTASDASAQSYAANSKLASLYEDVGRPNDAMVCLDIMIRGQDSADPDWTLWLGKARCLDDAGFTSEADDIFVTCISEATDPLTLAEAHITRGSRALSRQEIDIAADCARWLDSRAETLPPVLAFRASSLSAGLSALSGRLDEAETWSLRAMDLAEQSGRIDLQLSARHSAALVCMLKGCYGEALARMESVYEESARLGILQGRLQTALNLMHLRAQCGDLQGAARIGEATLAYVTHAGMAAMLRTNLAGVRAQQARYAEAEALAICVIREDTPLTNWVVPTARLVLAEIARARGDSNSFERELDLALKVALDSGAESSCAHVYVKRAEHCLGLGDISGVAHWLDRLGTLSRPPDKFVEVEARRIGAVHSAAEGSLAACDRLRTLLRDTQQMGLRLEEGRTLLALASLDDEFREEHLRAASDAFRECGAAHDLLELARVCSEENVPLFA